MAKKGIRGVGAVYRPRNERELVDSIEDAYHDGRKVRVIGSGHTSPAAAILASLVPGSPAPLNISLERLNNVIFRQQCDGSMHVDVEAGCHLGASPDTGARFRDGLVKKLDDRGYALPDLGGITHQSVGGFLSTGSAGSTVKYSNYQQVIGLKLVDGTGTVHTLRYDDTPPDDFLAAGIAMGLLGVITEVTLKPVKKYHIKGDAITTSLEDCEVDLFGDPGCKKQSLSEFLDNDINEYSRLLWWPQKGINRAVVWKAHKMKPEEYDEAVTGTFENFKPSPYELFDNAPLLSQLLGGTILHAVEHGWPPRPRRLRRLERVLPRLLDIFVPIKPRVHFWDVWHHGLPMDNAIADRLLPMEFTELHIPLDCAADVMRTLRDHYHDGGILATGPMCCELYASQGSNFYMNGVGPGSKYLKVDFLWYKAPGVSPQVYYQQFWELLEPFNFRLHWGKYRPENGAAWVDYIKNQYANWDKFLEIRERFDPNQLFVTPYWAVHLGI